MFHDRSGFAADRARPAAMRLDWTGLVAALAAHQAASRTARVATRIDGGDRPAASTDDLTDVFEGSRGRTAAANENAGRFHGGRPCDAALREAPRP